jgi:hypothetical protein
VLRGVARRGESASPADHHPTGFQRDAEANLEKLKRITFE